MKKCIPNRELDELGEGLVRTYMKRSGIRTLPRCVDVEGLAASMGLTIRYEKFAEEDSDKIGFLSDGSTALRVFRDRRIVPVTFPFGTIVLDGMLRRENESGKRRFTIAHEIAHYVLNKHDPIPEFQRSFDSERTYSVEELKQLLNWGETQADKLGACILMPSFILARALKDFNDGNKIRIFGDNVIAPEERIKLNKMAAQIGVSYTALLIRLRQYSLLDYRPLEEYIGATLFQGVTQ